MKMIFKSHPWHPSDQPEVLKKDDKKLLRKGKSFDFVKLFLINLILFPYLFVKFLLKKNNVNSNLDNSVLFYGLCVNLDKDKQQVSLVEELGVKSLQIRFFLSDMENIDKYVEFASSFGDDKEIVICVIQSREHILNKKLLKEDIKVVFEKFSKVSNEFIIGNAINRIKWGFVTVEEYLKFYETIKKVRDENFVDIKLIGSSVIDFEFHFAIRTLFNSYKIHFDRFSSLLYVDRRGSPRNKQFGLFDLKNKIELLDTIVNSSTKSENKIYITEVNWPLKGTAPFAPTSELECVGEEEYSIFMKEYFEIAKKTKKVEKVFWHQLISAGYGLVDDRDGKLRKREAFYEFKKIINNSKDDKIS